ncbi:hypothetical protein Emag_002413 [Eimeria magna]|uniref:Rhoptry kinase family protein ROP17 n=1 Tax=Eimeria magna TaxID=471282 RepID=A0A977JPZ1_9EIME|nr:putative rhoptry kinase family protein ROP17 [Eimeria magna]
MMRSACLSLILWPCLTFQGAQAYSLLQGHLSKTLHGYRGSAAQSHFVHRTHSRQASELGVGEPFSETFLQSRTHIRSSTALAPEAAGNLVAARLAQKRPSAHLDPLRGKEDRQGFQAVRQASSAFVQSSPNEGGDSDEGKAPERKGTRRSGGASKRITQLGRRVGKRVTAALQAARKLARRLQNYLVEKVKKLLSRIRSSHDSTTRESVPQPTGEGYREVARAVASAPARPVQGQLLRKVKVALEEKLLSRYMPTSKWLVFASLRDDRTILLQRHEILGAGPFGLVIAFLGDNGVKLAGKMVTVQESALQTQMRMQAQLDVLNNIPEGQDVYLFAQREQLAMPYDVLRLRNTPVVMSLPGGEDLVNAVIIREIFESDLRWLLRVLSPTRPEDRTALISVTRQAVSSISNLHKLGLLHLDIKPENFLVGGDGRLFASDFGLKEAGFLKASLKYSAQYAAPELADAITGEKALGFTEAADSWSLGVVLYEVWCRKLPYKVPVLKSPTLEMVARLTNESLKLDAECTKNMPPEILELIKQFLQIDPAARLTPRKAVESHPALASTSGAPQSEGKSSE